METLTSDQVRTNQRADHCTHTSNLPQQSEQSQTMPAATMTITPPITVVQSPVSKEDDSDDDSASEMFMLQKAFNATQIQDSLNVYMSRKSSVSCPSQVMIDKSVPCTGEETDTSESTKPAREVRFDTIKIRHYYMELGDNPACSIGPPVTLSWEYEEKEAEDLDIYEMSKRPRRIRDLILNYYRRRDILMNAGYTERDLKHAERILAKSQRRREATKFFLPVARVEEAVRGAGRKARNAVKGGNVISI